MSDVEPLDLWPVIYSCIRAFWRILSAPIDAAARRTGVPTDLYDYGELGLSDFSIAAFRRRDPYSNPENFSRTSHRWPPPAGSSPRAASGIGSSSAG